jgi:hypothetical protein
VEHVPGLVEHVPGLVEHVPRLVEHVPRLVEHVPGLVEHVPGLVEHVPRLVEHVPGLAEHVPGKGSGFAARFAIALIIRRQFIKRRADTPGDALRKGVFDRLFFFQSHSLAAVARIIK